MFSNIKNALSVTGIQYKKIVFILLVALISNFILQNCTTLSLQGVRMVVIFLTAMVGIILNVCHQILWLFLMIVIASVTGTVNVNNCFSGFTNVVPWLLFAVLSVSSVITSTTLGLRLAYFFMKKFGSSVIGLSYSIAFTELLIAPMLPSNTARAASVGLPLATSLAKYISSNVSGVSEKSIGQYLSVFYSFCNTISSGLFYTAMISNALIPEITASAGIKFTWGSWFKYMVIPYTIILLLMPIILKILCNPKVAKLDELQKNAEENYDKLGTVSSKEKVILSIFGGMLILWVLADYIHIPVLATTLLGLCTFVFLGILSMKDMLSNYNTFNSMMLLGILISLVNCLVSTGVIDWFNSFISNCLTGLPTSASYILLTAIYFYAQFFFTGESAKIVALYAPFFTTGLSLGINPIMLAVTLASFSSASDFLATYVCPTSLTMSSIGYVSLQKWVKIGGVMSIIFLSVWYSYAYFVWM